MIMSIDAENQFDKIQHPFSKSLIQFSVDGWRCVPSLLFTWVQTMVGVVKIMVTSFKRSHAWRATLSAPSPAAGHHRSTPPLETPGQQRHYFANKGPSGQGYGFSSGHVWMWEWDREESWVPKNWCFWTVVLEKTLESPLDCKEIQPVHPKGDQSWVFIGRTDVEAETPILWSPHAKSWLFGKDPDAGRDWGQEEKGMTEDEMAGWHHRLDGREFE